MEAIEYILLHQDNASIQLSPEHQAEYDLPKVSTVGELRKAVEAKKAPKPSPVKMVKKNDEITEL